MILKHLRFNKLVVVLAVLLISFAFFSIFAPQKTNAVSAGDWKPGRIIDDSVFFNKNAMSVSQIQDFLNAKVPNCDRWNPTTFSYAGKPYGPPYTCLKEYQENPATHENNIGRFNANGTPYNVPGGWSAAQIIWDASQAYNINPQSLIVLLQKETAIVTDPWSAGWQYDRAMGYGCPDSGPNGTANCNASYYGFYNQVGNAAWQLRRYVTNANEYNFKAGVTRNILWQVGGVCGSAPVYLENSATAALYNYTPYQPNQAALNNLYGTGDGCSAYGNRNFWRLFNDWFGSTISNAYDPVGSLDLVTQYNKSIRIAGWGFDRSTATPASIHTYVDGQWFGAVTANTPRSDIGTIYANYNVGNNRGFDALIPTSLVNGTHQLCAWVVGDNIGSPSYGLGCKTFVVNSNPVGSLDWVQTNQGSIRIAGWGFDRSTATPASIHTYVDGQWFGAYSANKARPDVASAFSSLGIGNNVGMDEIVAYSQPGTHQLCAWVVGDNIGSPSYGLGCKTFVVF